MLTVGVTLIALPSGLLIGTLLALVYVYGGKVAARAMNLYSTIFRGIPPIVLLFILFFVVTKGVNLSAFWAGSLKWVRNNCLLHPGDVHLKRLSLRNGAARPVIS